MLFITTLCDRCGTPWVTVLLQTDDTPAKPVPLCCIGRPFGADMAEYTTKEQTRERSDADRPWA